MIRTYQELRRLQTFEERYRYLRLGGRVGADTFGYDRYLNQILYKSGRWRSARNAVIVRDGGCDLGVDGHEIHGIIVVHHMNVITIDDIEQDRDEIYDPELLVSTSLNTHNAIHYGDKSLLPKLPVERRRNDTCPWR